MTITQAHADRRLPVARSLVMVEGVLMTVTTLESTALAILGMASPLPAVATGVFAVTLLVGAGRRTIAVLARAPQWILLGWGLIDVALASWIAHSPPPATAVISRVALPAMVLALTNRTGRR